MIDHENIEQIGQSIGIAPVKRGSDEFWDGVASGSIVATEEELDALTRGAQLKEEQA